MANLRLGMLLALAIWSLPNCGGNAEIGANQTTGGAPDSAGASSLNLGGAGGLVPSSGGITSTGGANASGAGGQTAVPTGCSQGAECTGTLGCQQYSPPYYRCQCNGGKYTCAYVSSSGGAPAAGGHPGVGGVTGGAASGQ